MLIQSTGPAPTLAATKRCVYVVVQAVMKPP